MSKINKIFIYITFFTISIPIFIFIIYPILVEKEEVNIPNIEGMRKYDAIVELEETNIKHNVIYVEDDSTVENEVLYTWPSVGSKVKEGFEVKVYVSRGSESFIIDNYIGVDSNLFLDNLEDLENRYNLNIYLIYEDNVDYLSDVIFYQSKSDGSVILSGETLVFKISKGVNEIEFPDFINNDISKVKYFERKYGLNIMYNYVYSNKYDKDIVISQNVRYGTVINLNDPTYIEVEISLGRDSGYIPDFEGIPIQEAVKLANYYNLDYNIQYIKSNQKVDTVISQDISVSSFSGNKVVYFTVAY